LKIGLQKTFVKIVREMYLGTKGIVKVIGKGLSEEFEFKRGVK
jgi:hypothetical protein